MTENSAVGIYRSLGEAEDAVRSLSDGGFPVQKVSIIAKQLMDDRRVHGFVTSCDMGKSAAVPGAWMGGIFGLLVGAAFLWVPGLGPLVVVGSLTAVLLGGIEGAVAGAAVTGVLGWLFSIGISKKHILKYEEAVRAGKYLVIAHGPADAVNKAREILGSSKAEHVDHHTSAPAPV